jgi:hypothetical protein
MSGARQTKGGRQRGSAGKKKLSHSSRHLRSLAM